MRKVVEQISPFDEWYTKYGPEAEVAHFWDGGDSGDSGSGDSGSTHYGGNVTTGTGGTLSSGTGSTVTFGGGPAATSSGKTQEQKQEALEAAAAKYDAEHPAIDPTVDSDPDGDPGDDRMGEQANMTEYAKSLVTGTPNPPPGALSYLSSQGLGKMEVRPGQTIDQALGSYNANEFLSQNLWPAVQALMSTVPGMSAPIAIANTIQGLASGQQTVGGIAVNTAIGALAQQIGVPAGVITNAINGDFGGAASTAAKSALSGAISAQLGIPQGLVNIGMNKSGVSATFDKSIGDFVSGQLGYQKPTTKNTDIAASELNKALTGMLPSSVLGSKGTATTDSDPTKLTQGSPTQTTNTVTTGMGTGTTAGTALASGSAATNSSLQNMIYQLQAQQAAAAEQAAQEDREKNGFTPYAWGTGGENQYIKPFALQNMSVGGTVRTEHDDVTDALINILRG